jgi:chlorite dismutase
MGERTLQYLIVYPFVKTHEWYQMPPEERRRMMTSHIRVGKTHQGIDQLLLYSTGLQDQEFVVAYESDDLAAFSLLVSELRMTEARLYTERDTPVHVGMYVGPDEPTDSWL